MTSFPKQIKFIRSGQIAELQETKTKDKVSYGTYVYLDDGTIRIGKVTGEEYVPAKTGKAIEFDLQTIQRMIDRMTVEILIQS